jgi:hypothetical protein
MTPLSIAELLNRALEEEMGMYVKTTNPHRLKIQLYDAIALDKARYGELMIAIPSEPDLIIIIKKSVEVT